MANLQYFCAFCTSSGFGTYSVLFMPGEDGFTEETIWGVIVGDTCGLGVLKGVGLVGRNGVIGDVEETCGFPESPKFRRSRPGDWIGASEGTLGVFEEPETIFCEFLHWSDIKN